MAEVVRSEDNVLLDLVDKENGINKLSNFRKFNVNIHDDKKLNELELE